MTVSIKDFVKSALMDITDAVAEAKAEAKISIAPGSLEGKKLLEPQMVEFELNVEATTERKASGSAGIELPVLGVIKARASVDGEGASSSQSSQKISFEVPVYFQAQTQKEER